MKFLQYYIAFCAAVDAFGIIILIWAAIIAREMNKHE
jgi:hypothetical protein